LERDHALMRGKYRERTKREAPEKGALRSSLQEEKASREKKGYGEGERVGGRRGTTIHVANLELGRRAKSFKAV